MSHRFRLDYRSQCDFILDPMDSIRESSPDCITGIDLFASPEALEVRKQMCGITENTDEVNDHDNNTTENANEDSECAGIDIPLEVHSKDIEKESTEESSSSPRSTNSSQPPTSKYTKYWRKLANSVKINNNLNGTNNLKSTTKHIPISDKQIPMPPPTKGSVSPRSVSLRSRRASVSIPVVKSSGSEDHRTTKSDSFIHGKFSKAILQPSPPQITFAARGVLNNRASNLDVPASHNNNDKDSCSFDPSELEKIRNRTRFGRRLSLPLPSVVGPSPRRVRTDSESDADKNETDENCLTTTDNQDIETLVTHSTSTMSTSPPYSELQKTVTELRQERSLVISHLNSPSIDRPLNYIQQDNNATAAASEGLISSPRRLLNRRRASDVCSVQEFNNRRNSVNIPNSPRRKSASLESLHRLHEARRPTPIEELAEYFDIKADDVKSIPSVHGPTRLSTISTPHQSTWSTAKDEGALSANTIMPSMPQSGEPIRAWQGRRRGSLPSIRDESLKTLQNNHAVASQIRRSSFGSSSDAGIGDDEEDHKTQQRPCCECQQKDNVSMYSGQTAITNTTLSADSGYLSCSSGSYESADNKMLPARHPGRRKSLPCMQGHEGGAQYIERQRKHEVIAKHRTDVEIVEDIENEIQQRISKRKLEIVTKAGGAKHHSRLQERAKARSTGGRLKQALTEMHNSRTTAELLQIASDRYDIAHNGK